MAYSGNAFGGSPRNVGYVVVNLITSFFGTLASVVTILLIRRMKATTGHVHLVFLMSVYQLMYDVSFFFAVVNIQYYVVAVSKAFQLFGGVASSIMSNWIAFVALYVVWYRQRLDIFQSIRAIHWTSLLPSIVTSFVSFISDIPKSNENPKLESINVIYVYDTIRWFSIFLNFVFTFLIVVKVYQYKSTESSRQEVAIRTLAKRMIFYPIIQAISRSGLSWYEYAYGARFDVDDADNLKYSSMIFASVITPTVSIGYLFIFLIMQPNAYLKFKNMLLCRASLEEEEINHGARGSVLSNLSASSKNDFTSECTAPSVLPLYNQLSVIDRRDDEELFAILMDNESFSLQLSSTKDSLIRESKGEVKSNYTESNHTIVIENIIHQQRDS
jgi:hypothetical protein